MENFEDMKALASLCEEAGNEKFKQINAIRSICGVSLPMASDMWRQLFLAGILKTNRD